MIQHRTLHILMFLLFFLGIAGVAVHGKTINKPIEEVGMCPDDLYFVWHGQTYTEPGTYTYTKTLSSGDKELYTLVLYDMQLRTISAQMMEGTRVSILGKDYTTEGTYYDTIYSTPEGNCDTLVRINIQYGEYFHEYDTIHKCQDDPWPVWHGIQTNKPGTYYDPHPYYYGRDSIYQLTLIEHYDVEYWDTIYVCPPQTVYYLNGRRIDKDGDYDSDVKSQYGCDSLIHAHIVFSKEDRTTVNEIKFCGNISIIRRDVSMVINQPTSFFDTIPNRYGCDSIIETRYTPLPTHLSEQISQIYEGKDTVNWRDSIYTEVGVYYDTLPNQYGCDSIFVLRVIPKTDTCLTVNTCAGEKIQLLDSLGNKWFITQDTIIIDSLKNMFGGDSLVHTTYNFVQPFHQSQSITICSNQHVTWKGHIREGEEEEIVLHEEGIYRDEHKTANGCDSTYTIEVTVLPAYNDTLVFVQCNDSLSLYPIRWTDSKGKKHVWSRPNTDTIISDTMSHTMPEYLEFEDGSTIWAFNTGGCDSIINYHIVTGNFCSKLDTIYMCGNNAVKVDDTTYTQPGVYYTLLYSHRNLGVRDSIHNFEIVQVFPTTETRDLILHQLELPYPYEGEIIKKDGLHTFYKKTHYGCDSIIYVNVTVLPTIVKPAVTVLICPEPGSYYRFPDGRQYSEPGTYTDTVFSHSDLINDTIVQVTLKWAETLFLDKVDYFLHGQSYTWEGHQENGVDRVFTEPGVYWDKQKNRYGCDSIYRLELKEAEPFYDEELPITICFSELPYTWHNKSILSAGTYYDSLYTVYGLDSIWKVEIIVNPSYDEVQTISLCPNETFTLTSGKVISGSAMSYQEEYKTALGCDSIITYYINRPEALIHTIPAWFKRGDVYTWNTPLNHTILCEHAGLYFDTLRSTGGCDSIIYQLSLTEENSYFIREDTAICRSEGGYYLWHGKQYFSSGIYYDSTTTHVGLDSVYELHLTFQSDTLVQSTHYLCPEGDSINFFGHWITQPNVYRVTIPRETTGCDSIVEWVVQYADTREIEKHITLCEGESQELNIGGKTVTVTQTGIYRDTAYTSQGCERVTVYYVTVGHPFFLSTEEMINPGSTYTWTGHHHDTVLSVPGTYFDSCTTVLGCDSIYKLTLRLNQEKYIFPTENDYVCSADLPYVWHHKSLTQTGLYYDSLKTNKGLDSIYSIYLTVYPTIHERKEYHYCQGQEQQVVINGVTYEKDAVFTDTLTSWTGCDSIVDYVLHFHQSYNITKIVPLSEGETYQLGDTTLKTSGTYSRKLVSVHGCDSLVTIIIKSCPTPELVTFYYDKCQGEHIEIGGQTITTSGTYYEHLTTASGCDSTICHIVNIHSPFLSTKTEKICEGDSYKWNGHLNDTIIKDKGVYYDRHTTIHGCDSTYKLILNYKHTDIKDSIISICRNDLPYQSEVDKKLYYKDSVFVQHLGYTTDGCDSILRWNYRINDHCSDYLHYNRCPDEILPLHGLIITEEGVYQQHYLTETGQDSLLRFIVHDVKRYEFDTYLPGCDSVTYKGKTYYARGPGRESFTVDLNHRTVDGCDSIEHLKLTIYMSSPAKPYSVTIADYDSVRFGPYWYNTPGSYPLHYTNKDGCDSTVILNLTVLETEHPDILHYYVCEDDPNGVEVFGQRIYPTQEYTYIVDTTWINGKPVIRTADIKVQHPFTVSRFEPNNDQIVCSAHEVLFYVNYATVDASILPDYYEVDFLVGDLEAHPLHQVGQVDGHTTLPILMGGQGKYVSPGYYRYRLKLRSESCVVSDTILEGSIVVRYPSDVMEASWNDAVMLVNEKYNGGSWVFQAPYKWQVLSEQGVDKTALVVGDVTQPYLYSTYLEEGDRIVATLMREGYGRPVPSCEFIFVPKLPERLYPILVEPTAVKAHMPVTVTSKHAGSFRLLDYTGRVYTSGQFIDGETQITMPGTEGCYIIVLEDEQGNKKTQKLIVL